MSKDKLYLKLPIGQYTIIDMTLKKQIEYDSCEEKMLELKLKNGPNTVKMICLDEEAERVYENVKAIRNELEEESYE